MEIDTHAKSGSEIEREREKDRQRVEETAMNQRGVTLERKCDELVILYNSELKIMKIC